jgi:spore germination protein GerM
MFKRAWIAYIFSNKSSLKEKLVVPTLVIIDKITKLVANLFPIERLSPYIHKSPIAVLFPRLYIKYLNRVIEFHNERISNS